MGCRAVVRAPFVCRGSLRSCAERGLSTAPAERQSDRGWLRLPPLFTARPTARASPRIARINPPTTRHPPCWVRTPAAGSAVSKPPCSTSSLASHVSQRMRQCLQFIAAYVRVNASARRVPHPYSFALGRHQAVGLLALALGCAVAPAATATRHRHRHPPPPTPPPPPLPRLRLRPRRRPSPLVPSPEPPTSIPDA